MLFILFGFGAIVVWLWGFGGSDVVMRFAASAQRETQNAMATSLRAIKAGQAGALLSLWGLCFTYGFVHAAGPGHGKLIIGGYGVGARVAARRLVGLAFASSLAQSLCAVAVVTLALWVLGWGRAQLTDLADKTMAPLSYALIAAFGIWLMSRGLRRAWALRKPSHNHHADGVCNSCGHAHGPTPEQAAKVHSFREGLAVVLSIAVRPCTGAIFLLILTHGLGIMWAGIAGVFIMGLGTALFTAIVALAAVSARESVLAQTASGPLTAKLIIGAEAIAGATITLVALQLLAKAI
ncbi:nickel/cobalt transporter [Yoonia sp. MH D7]